MLENKLEQYLSKRVKDKGGLSFKWASPGVRGVPDRIIIFDGRVIFVELKTETGRLSKLQEYMISKLCQHGCQVKILHGRKEVDEFLKDY